MAATKGVGGRWVILLASNNQEDKDAAKYPTVHGGTPTTNSYQTPNVGSVQAEKSCYRVEQDDTTQPPTAAGVGGDCKKPS